MIDGLKPYPKYKDSGVPWLGEVPEHWEVRRNGRLFAERREVGFPDLPILEVSLRTGVQVRNVDSGNRKQAVGDRAVYKRARAGDIAYNMMRMWQGAVGVAPVDGLISPAYVVARPFAETDSRFFEYFFRTPTYMAEVNNYSRGIVADRNRLYWDEFKDVPSPTPPREEQALIVRFLRNIDRRISRTIRAKKKLIVLLNEQKQAIIHHAVTRGLDPVVRLKPSGVEWLGDVPDHWQVMRFGRVIDLTTGFPFKSEGFSQRDGDIRLLRGINISPGRVRWDTTVRWNEADRASFATYELKLGDIVLGMDRPIISSGIRVAQVTEADLPSLVLQRVARIRPRRDLHSEFGLLSLQGSAFARYLAPIFTGISVPHVSPEQISSFQLAIPSLDEQRGIVDFVHAATETINRLRGTAETEVTLLREVRTRLITDVAYGKLDVREAATHLPVEELADELPEIGDTPEERDETDSDVVADEVED